VTRRLMAVANALLAGLLVYRGLSLASKTSRLSAHEERRWLSWAYRDPGAERLFVSVGTHLRPGELVELEVPPGHDAESWLRSRALYYWAGQELVGIGPSAAPRTLRAHATVVWFRPDGQIRIARPRSSSDAR
jgi:hypothetical protein